ncbi:cytidine deaminase [Bacteroidia bacterium]|nr:cytidine deaminase [Bacteroidia bacterium]GHT28232.1 cytidine deaminase [Bacteroidia bacterium]GHV70838.1 cytidine deaminase [Bacteroidia bacterium]
MKQINITAKIIVCNYNELNSAEKILIDKAKEATFKAYAPYSKFQVGAAALLANGEIVTGNNQENVAFPSGLCAERTTLFYANAQYPDHSVKSLAIAAYTNGDFLEKPISPCGACRQVILETEMRYNQAIRILLYGEKDIYIIEGINDLLPLAFGSIEAI